MAKKAKGYDDDSDSLRMFEPRNPLQKAYLNSILTEDVTIGIGAAGTGKTFISAYAAARLYLDRRSRIDRIIITKPMVETGGGSRFGSLPGTKDEKFAPWLGSIIDPMQDFLTKGKFECDFKRGNIVLEPLSFCRGRSFRDSIIIVEESQNCTVEEIKMISTRIGENSKLIITGDTTQCDLRRDDSGLAWLVNQIDEQGTDINVFRFGKEHCVRSGACAMMLELIENAYANRRGNV